MSKSREARNRLLSYLGLAALVVLVAVVVAYNMELPGWESPITFPKLGGGK